MSEKHDPSGGTPGESGAADDANPFSLTPAEPAARAAAPRVPPAEVDADVEKLQASPADLSESPKTIVSDALPSWPSWTDGNLPPIVIYGPTSFRRTPASVPIENAPQAGETSQAGGGTAERGASPDLPSASAPAEPDTAGLDEIFDSIDSLGAPPAGTPSFPATPATLMSETPFASQPSSDEPIPEQPSAGSTDWSGGPATMSGAWPPAPATTAPGMPLGSGPATMSGQWPPAPMTEDFADPGPETREGLLSASDEMAEPIAESSQPAQLSDDVPPEPTPADTIPIDEEPPPLPADALEEDLPAAPTVPTPSTMAVSAIPFEVEELPVAAVAGAAVGVAARGSVAPASAGGYAHDASHGQTAAEFFTHAHEDVEKRRGVLSLGLLTRLAGISGLVACIGGLAIMMLACAGMTQLSDSNIETLRHGLMWGAIGVGGIAVLLSLGSILFKSWKASAAVYAVLAIVMGGGWFALGHFQAQVAGFNILSVTEWLTYLGLGGIGLTIVGGFLEHRRLREETAVLASLFSNALASVGGGLLWWLSTGASLFGK